MLNELITASELLFAALERYSIVCSTIQKFCARRDKSHIAIQQLLLRMDTEIKLASSLEGKLRQAKTAISWSMNRMLSNAHTTVNSLPPEILFCIFHLVLSSQSCAKRDYRRIPEAAEPAHPIALSHVCSSWRGITLNSPSLWSHLDISTSQLLNRQRLHDRTKLYLNQVAQLPLDLHVFNPLGYSVATSHSSDFAAVVQLIARLASRAYSFTLDARYGYFHPGHGEILSRLFQRCAPGKLVQLTLRRRHDELEDDGDGYGFLKSEDGDDDDDDAGGLGVGVSTNNLEGVLSPLTVLRLDGLYPRWGSRAYHGLVELRLNGAKFRIDEAELVGILRSSPLLRVFEFGLIIDNPIPADTQVTLIPLKDLETLNLIMMQCYQLPTLLRWLAPGSKCLQFAVERLPEEELNLKENSSKWFFARSHITRAYFIGPRSGDFLDFLELLPQLRALVLRRLDPLDSLRPRDNQNIQVTKRHLNYLYIVEDSINTEGHILPLLTHPALSINKIVFHRCDFFNDPLYGTLLTDREVALYFEQNWSSRNINFILLDPREPCPTAEWGMFAPGEEP